MEKYAYFKDEKVISKQPQFFFFFLSLWFCVLFWIDRIPPVLFFFHLWILNGKEWFIWPTSPWLPPRPSWRKRHSAYSRRLGGWLREQALKSPRSEKRKTSDKFETEIQLEWKKRSNMPVVPTGLFCYTWTQKKYSFQQHLPTWRSMILSNNNTVHMALYTF